jgi:hypothetical protein
MSALLLNAPIRNWKCPSCLVTDRTQRSDAHTQFHNCPAINGACIPLVEVHDLDDKPDGRQVIVPCEVGHLSSVRTERGDGSNDCTVFAQPAVATTTT